MSKEVIVVDPGAVKYGNFKNYYSFNPVEKRLQLVPMEVLPKKATLYALDIGCNSGVYNHIFQYQIYEINSFRI